MFAQCSPRMLSNSFTQLLVCHVRRPDFSSGKYSKTAQNPYENFSRIHSVAIRFFMSEKYMESVPKCSSRTGSNRRVGSVPQEIREFLSKIFQICSLCVKIRIYRELNIGRKCTILKVHCENESATEMLCLTSLCRDQIETIRSFG